MKIKLLLAGLCFLCLPALCRGQYNFTYHVNGYSANALTVFQSSADQTYTVSWCYTMPAPWTWGAYLMCTDRSGNIIASKMLDDFILFNCRILETDNRELLIAFTGKGSQGVGLYVMRYDAVLNDLWPQMQFVPTGLPDNGSVLENIDIAATTDFNDPTNPEAYLILYNVKGDANYPNDFQVAVLKLLGDGTPVYNNMHVLASRGGTGYSYYQNHFFKMVRMPGGNPADGYTYAIAGTNCLDEGQPFNLFVDRIEDAPGQYGTSINYHRYFRNAADRPSIIYDGRDLVVGYTTGLAGMSVFGLAKIDPATSRMFNARSYYYYSGGEHRLEALTQGLDGNYRLSGYISNRRGDATNPNIWYIDNATMMPLDFVRYNVDAWAYMYSPGSHTTSALDENYLIASRQDYTTFLNGLRIIQTGGTNPAASVCGSFRDVIQVVPDQNVDVQEQFRTEPLPPSIPFQPAYFLPGCSIDDCNASPSPDTWKPTSTAAAPYMAVTQPKVYPTLFGSGKPLNILLPQNAGACECRIFNAQGQLVYSSPIEAGRGPVTIQPQLLSSGVYLLTLTDSANKTSSFKITCTE